WGQQSLSRCRCAELADSLQGDAHPVGTVIELIAQFIDGLLQQVGIQAHLTLVPRRWQQGRRTDGGEIRVYEPGRDPAVPHLGPGLEGSECLGRRRRAVMRLTE